MAAYRARRVRRTAATVVVSVLVAGLCGSCAAAVASQPVADYCAILPDSVGLYVDNPVTQMGYRIGTVKAVTPSATSVRVDFALTEQRPLPGDVRAVIRSTSILADRSLELVGNYDGGAQLTAGGCVPLARTATPKSLSEVIGSATTFVNAFNPSGSTNVGGTVNQLEASLRGNGPSINTLLTTTSAVFDSPDQAVSDVGSIVTNLGQLTSTLRDIEGPLREIIVDAAITTPDVERAALGAAKLVEGILYVTKLVGDIEAELGGEIQQTLDVVAVALRKMSPRAPFYASLLSPAPVIINALANKFNASQIFKLQYRPPLYRVRTPNGLLQCGLMNAAMPGSCADVAGTPYSIDVNLLQYVLTEAQNR